jgi:hypothetical protein
MDCENDEQIHREEHTSFCPEINSIIVSYVSSIVRYQRAYFQAKLTRSPLKGHLRSKYLHLYFSRDCKCILTENVLFKGERVSLA